MNKLIEIKFGSHLYGTDTENSDLDFKGIYLPTAKEICLGNYKKTICTTRPKQIGERNIKNDVGIEFFSLDRFMELLCQGQTVALDMLFSPEFTRRMQISLESSKILSIIRNSTDKFLNKNTNAFVGYTQQQAAKYGIRGSRMDALKRVCDLLEKQEYLSDKPRELLGEVKLKEAIEEWNNPYIKIVSWVDNLQREQFFLEVCDKKIPFHLSIKEAYKQCKARWDAYGFRARMAQNNEGIDWKALSHAVRVASEAKELLETGFITFPRPDRELLLKIKLGQMPYDQVSEIIESGLEDIKIASERSTLPEAPDREWCDEFVYDVYKQVVKGEAK